MRRSVIVKASIILLVGILTNVTTAFACTQDQTGCDDFGPPLPGCQQLFYDHHFSENCSYWVKEGWGTGWATVGGDSFYEINSWGGAVRQRVQVPAGLTRLELVPEVYFVKNRPGTEYMQINIYSDSFQLLETFPRYYASSSNSMSGRFYPRNYAGQTIWVEFRAVRGGSPGDTFFRVTEAILWTSP